MPPAPGLAEKLHREGRILPNGAAARQRGIDRPSAFPTPPSGSFNLLAVAVEFSDQPSNVAATAFDTLVFGAVGTGSVADYYQEVSYGTLTLVTVDLPGTIGWQTAPNGYNSATGYVNADGVTGTSDDYGWGAYPQNLQGIVADMLPILDPLIDFSQYDNDGDGLVDSIVFIHAGQGAELTGSPNDIWSAAWNLSAGNGPGPLPTQDGVSVDNFAFDPEYMVTPGDQTIGVYCHELGHTLFGLPDLYDLDNSSYGAGYWSLMSRGGWNGPLIWVPWIGWIPDGSSPAWPDAWSRTVMGFDVPMLVGGNVIGFHFPPVEQSPGQTAQLQTPQLGPDEYFLIENRQQMMFDSFLPGAGLLIWHVDEEKWNRWELNRYECTTQPNCTCPVWHPMLSLEQADGLLDMENKTNAGDTGDPYPGTSSNMTFGVGTTPESGSWLASPCPGNSCITVTVTSASAGLITTDLETVCRQPGACVEVVPAQQTGWGDAGTTSVYRAAVRNCGNAFDFITLSTQSTWPTTIYDISTGQPVSQASLFAGSAWPVGLSVTVPPSATAGVSDQLTLTARSAISLAVSGTASIETRVPHSVLLVDDDRHQPDVEGVYAQALSSNWVGFDMWDTAFLGSPDANALAAHDAAVWFTATPWPDTLGPRDELALAHYLDGGGRLFLVSQEYLYDAGRTPFGRDYLGVATYTHNVSTTMVTGVVSDPVGQHLGPYLLLSPAPLSDRLQPFPPASAAFVNQHGGINGLSMDGGTWRTVFLAWPFEDLLHPHPDAVMQSTMRWLGVLRIVYMPVILRSY
jgi:immune inhibitor A